MSAENYLKTAERLLKKGDSVTIVKITQGEYNPSTGQPATTEEYSYTKGFVEPANQALVGSGIANYNDITILLKSPLIDSTYEIGYQGKRYNIIAILDVVSTEDTIIIYKVLCRL